MNLGFEPKKMRKNTKYMGKMLRKRWDNMSDYDLDDALQVFGLRRAPKPASRFFSGMGLVLGGAAVGIAIGMMFSPRTRKPYPHVQAPTQRHRQPHQGGQVGAP